MRSGDRLTAEAVEEQVQKILRSAGFARCVRMRRFLEYTVHETLSGRGGLLKEYSIALNVYDKPPSFDPRFDSIIRVEAGRLRAKLRKYYETDGREDAVRVFFPRCRYEPRFDPLEILPEPVAPESSPEARRLYLKGLHFLAQYDAPSMEAALRCFAEACSIAPTHHESLAGMAAAHASCCWLESVHPREGWAKSEHFSRRALALEPRQAEAGAVLACQAALFDRQWETAERQFRAVLDLHESSAAVHQMYGFFCLAPMGRLDEAEVALLRACELAPASAIARYQLGRILHFKRRFDLASEQFRRAIELQPRLALARWGLGETAIQQGHWAEARRAFAAVQQLSDIPRALEGLGRLAALTGKPEEAETLLGQLRQLASTRYVSPVGLSVIYTAMGRLDDALDQLFAAAPQRAIRLTYVSVDPAFDALKTHDRFLPLLEQLRPQPEEGLGVSQARAS
ncbi:MAG TPA: tetratricopeptide repeat protein [Terriglobia bacterium]|nr:tetratricopeptide repeat protein [Terriglobia bacterium]